MKSNEDMAIREVDNTIKEVSLWIQDQLNGADANSFYEAETVVKMVTALAELLSARAL